jgi:hypothetical protein
MHIVAPDNKVSVIQDPSDLSIFTLSGWVHQWAASPPTTMNVSITLKSLYGDMAMADHVRLSLTHD